MHASSRLRVVLAVALITFAILFFGARAERDEKHRSGAQTANETELSVDASGSLTAAHAQNR